MGHDGATCTLKETETNFPNVFFFGAAYEGHYYWSDVYSFFD